jgi:hypothetical protein
MANLTQIADVIVPSVFTPYVQQITEEKSRLIQSGALVRDGAVDVKLAGGGLTFNMPSWKDLTNDTDNVSTDDEFVGLNAANATTLGITNTDAAPKKLGTGTEIAVRLSRNQSWSEADLTSALAGADPASSVAARVGYYWTRRLQAAFVASMKGVFANNAKATPGGGAVQNDLTNDVSGGSYTAGVTDFSASAFLDAILTIGDSLNDLSLVMVHSIVYGRMQKNNLIDFIPDARGETMIATYQGKQVIVDDGMPNTGGVFDSWIFGPGALRLGVGSPTVPTETQRRPAAGNGGGQSTLYNRVEWCIHPVGHKYAVPRRPRAARAMRRRRTTSPIRTRGSACTRSASKSRLRDSSPANSKTRSLRGGGFGRHLARLGSRRMCAGLPRPKTPQAHRGQITEGEYQWPSSSIPSTSAPGALRACATPPS